MSFFFLHPRRSKRPGRRRSAHICQDPEAVFRSFVRALERLSRAPRGGAPANVGAVREKA